MESIFLWLARAGPERALTIWHEDLVADPRATLALMCGFLNLSVDERYLEASAAIVTPPEARPPVAADWSGRQRAALDRLISVMPFLLRYRA